MSRAPHPWKRRATVDTAKGTAVLAVLERNEGVLITRTTSAPYICGAGFWVVSVEGISAEVPLNQLFLEGNP